MITSIVLAFLASSVTTTLSESLTVRLEPVQQAVAAAREFAESGQKDSAIIALRLGVKQWNSFVVVARPDTTGRPAGWAKDLERISSRFLAADSVLRPDEPALAVPLIERLEQLLVWLPRPKPVVLEFASPGCKSCRTMEKILDKVVEEYAGRVVVRTININKEIGLAKRYRVWLLPTIVFLDRDSVVQSRVARPMTKAEVKAKLDPLLNGKF